MIFSIKNLFKTCLVAVALGGLLGLPVHGQSQFYEKGKDGVGLSYSFGFGEGGNAHTGAASLINNGRLEVGGSFSLITSSSTEEELYADRSWGLNFGWNVLKHSPGLPIGLKFHVDYLNMHYPDAEGSGPHTRATAQTLSIGIDPYLSISLKSHGRIHLNSGYHHIMSSSLGVGGGIEQGIPIQAKYVFNRLGVSKIAIGGGAMLYLQSGTAAGNLGITYLLHEKD